MLSPFLNSKLWGKRLDRSWPYLAGAVLVLVIFGWVFCARFSISLRYPLAAPGDLWIDFTIIKALIHGEWWPFGLARLQHVGAPFGPVLLGMDYPLPMQLQYVFFRLIGFFTSNPFLVLNVYYLLGFVLAAWAMIFACRSFRIGPEISLGMGILFTFLPFHFFRYGHILLAAYFLVPIAGVILFWLWSAKPLFTLKDSPGPWWKRLDRKTWITIVAAILIGWWHIYYTFFFCGFVAVAGLSAAWYRKTWRHLAAAGLVLALVVFSLGLMLAPVIYAQHVHGKNPAIATRAPVESEVYGLKIVNLMLPFTDHVISPLRKLGRKYISVIGGGVIEYQGLVGLAGLMLALLGLLWIQRKPNTTIKKLSILSGAGILYATIGGFSSLFALLVSPQLRCPERIKPYLAFFGLWTIAWLLQQWKPRFKNARHFYLILGSLLLFGMIDQISLGMVFQDTAGIVEPQRRFIQAIEQQVPRGAVLQLPFMPFPEVGPIQQMQDYSHFRAPLYSDNLTWSYGALKGRPESKKIEDLSQAPLDLDKIRAAGYVGLFLDRWGYAQKQIPEENRLRQALGAPLESEDQRFLFFKL